MTTGCVTCGGPYRGDKERSVVSDPLYRGPYGHSKNGECVECHILVWDDQYGWLERMICLTHKQFLRTTEFDPERSKDKMRKYTPTPAQVARWGYHGTAIRGSAMFRWYCQECGQPIRIPTPWPAEPPLCDECSGEKRRLMPHPLAGTMDDDAHKVSDN